MVGYGFRAPEVHRPTLIGTLFTLAVAWLVVMPFVVVLLVGVTAWIQETTGAGAGVRDVATVVGVVAWVVVTRLAFRIRRSITTRIFWWCDRCGTKTDPQFEICRTCKRVKQPTEATA